MISINKAVWIARANAAARKSAAWVVDLVAQARASRFVRKFSWRKAFRFLGLSLFLTTIGFLVGVMAVVLPPMASLATVAIPVLLLIWTAPELRRVPTKLLHKVMFVVLFAQTSIPAYYAVQIPGLPWFSIRRIAVLSLIVLFAVSVSGSNHLRTDMNMTLSENKGMYLCVVGYYVFCILSIITSQNPSESLSVISDFTLSGFVPLLVCVAVIRSAADLNMLLMLIGAFSFVSASLGVADFVTHSNHAASFLPASLANAMMETNPALVKIFNETNLRGGEMRAASIFSVSLSLGEFAAIVGPIGGYFLAHGEKWGARLFGAAIILACITSLYTSGARGGSLAFLVAMATFLLLWVVRTSRANPNTMYGALGGAAVFMGLITLVGLVFTVGALRRKVFGGAETASSDTSRFDQAKMAWPHILANPLTGYGVGNAGVVIGYTSPGGGGTVDSSLLTLVVETGVPGLVLFFGMLFTMAWATARIYVNGKDRDSAAGATLACSAIAYAIYRLVLSQRENQSLLFILVGCAFAFIKFTTDQSRAKAKQAARSPVTARKPNCDRAPQPRKPVMTFERPV